MGAYLSQPNTEKVQKKKTAFAFQFQLHRRQIIIFSPLLSRCPPPDVMTQQGGGDVHRMRRV